MDHFDRHGQPVWAPGLLLRRVGQETGRPLWVIEDASGQTRVRGDREVRSAVNP